MARRTLPWSMARLGIQADRAPHAEIRECPLRITGLRWPKMVALSCWRGRSGRRYVVSVHPISAAPSIGGAGLVGLAVKRDAEGRATIAEVRTRLAYTRLPLEEQAGITEIHVYRLADGWGEQHAAIIDFGLQENDRL